MYQCHYNKYIVKYLDEHKLDIGKENNIGKTLIFYACKMEVKLFLRYLVKYGKGINKEDITSKTPLFIAC
eukprot:jgi/Orpsp1_1/1181905/evm.model.c7180000079087.1